MGKAFNGGNCVANRVDVSEILQQIGNLIESLVLQELEQGLEPKTRQPHLESGLDSRGGGTASSDGECALKSASMLRGSSGVCPAPAILRHNREGR